MTNKGIQHGGFSHIEIGDGEAFAICNSWDGSHVHKIAVTPAQVTNIARWRSGALLLQDALPEFTDDQREMMLTGIDPATWERMFKEEEE